ncbi:hypothetical protein HRG_008416 [Hirsutella rhossiliensis]|uniref:Uncharacterized protein n=1 Tax=Hirsutella rhossiliensis TaxID=111463 RepID=A0A9P8SGS6_9HYPO|nr:uncharacterized protein HRG_08416 [Hirsutella rhossiliensis]KAH0960261.1 hypothetical protein HRG_08416 [Hirsutella rhossiliensis]
MTGTHAKPQHNPNLPGPAPNTAGPHRHDWLNRLDPTVDSMTSGVQVTGPGVHGPGREPGFGRTPASTHVNQSGVGTAGAASSAAQRQDYAGEYGARHDSKLGNTVDPRVDASRQSVPGVSSGPAAGVREGTYGPHDSRAANALDPRVDSDLDSRGAGATMHGGSAPYPGAASAVSSGPAPKTAGKHRSDWANRLDPTVDSKPRHDYTGVRNA